MITIALGIVLGFIFLAALPYILAGIWYFFVAVWFVISAPFKSKPDTITSPLDEAAKAERVRKRMQETSTFAR